MERFKISLIALIFSFITVFGVGVFAFAQTKDLKDIEGPYANHPEVQDLNKKISDKQKEIDNLKDAASQYQDKIAQSRDQAATLSSQLALIDNQITKNELDVKTTQITIDKTKLEIEATKFENSKEEEEIVAQKNHLREYIKLINKEDQRSLLEILILNDSFSEFYNQLNYIEGIQSDLKRSVDRLQLLKNTLEVKQANLEIYQTQLAEQKKELELQQEKLKEDLTAKESILYETKSSEAKYQNLMAEAKGLQSEVSDSISGIKDEIKRKVENLSSGNNNPNSTLIMWPVTNAYGITTYFNDPDYPFRYLFEHSALDIRQPQGSPIKAPADGYVARARDNGYGYSYITLIHDNGISTVYGHVTKILVRPDQFVKAGEVIGLSGGAPHSRGSGNLTTGPHLHFEVRLNGIPVDPLKYLPY